MLLESHPAVLQILPHCKLKLLDEDLLEGVEAVLLIENRHYFLVINGINRTEIERTVTIENKKCIVGDASIKRINQRKVNNYVIS